QEVCVAIKEELEKMAGPARESAIAAYKTCVGKSNELNTFTSYSTKCVHALEQVQPDAYPPIVERRVEYQPSEKVQNLGSNGLIFRSYSAPSSNGSKGDGSKGDGEPRGAPASGANGGD